MEKSNAHFAHNEPLSTRDKIVYPINYLQKKWVKAPDVIYPTVNIWGNQPPAEQAIPKIIWLFWDKRPFPDLINICIQNLKLLNPDYEIHVLTVDDVDQYLTDFNYSKFNVTIPLYTDILRLNLLSHYGGIWMDITSFTTKSFDQIFEILKCDLHSVLLLSADYYIQDPTYPIFESWFIAAPKENSFIEKWFEITLADALDTPSYQKTLTKENVQGIEDPIYLRVLLGAQKAMRQSRNYRIQYVSSFDFGFNYCQKVGSQDIDKKQAVKTLCFNKAPDFPPLFIKFTGGGHLLRQILESPYLNKNSIMGKLLY